ncbi:MAG: DUF2336 domain-containing protein [Hyphomicrobiales bacterium]
MTSLIGVEDYHRVFEEPCPVRRGRIAGALFADYDSGALTASEARTARSLFRAIVRDPAADTRKTFADMTASSRGLPADLALIVAVDIEPVAARFVQTSPALDIETLVDIIGLGQAWRQVAVARRAVVSLPVAAALAEVAAAQACVALLENEPADIPLSAFARMQERFCAPRPGGDCAGDDEDAASRIGSALLNRKSVPGPVIEAQIMATSDRLLNFVESTGWMGTKSVPAAVANAVEHALVEFATGRPERQVAALVRRWAPTGRVTPMLVLRAAAYGEFQVALHGLAALSAVPVARAWALAGDAGPYGLRGLCTGAGLPAGSAEFIASARTLTGCHRFGSRRDFVLRGLIAGQENFAGRLAALPMKFARESGLIKPKPVAGGGQAPDARPAALPMRRAA